MQSIELNGYPGEDAQALASGCQSLDPPLPTDWLGEANRYVSPVGLTPGRGGILLRRSYLDKIDLSGKLNLSIGYDEEQYLPNIRAVGDPRCINVGAADPVYLVPLSDRRIDLMGATSRRYQWRYTPTDTSPASGTTSQTTWQGVAQELWSLGGLGAWPGLPAEVPTPTAEVIDHLDLHGFRVVDALEDVLGALGCAAYWDHKQDVFRIAYFPRVVQDRSLDAFDRYKGRLVYDASPYEPPSAGPIPATVCVLFPVWYPKRRSGDPRRFYSVPVSRPSAVNWAKGSELTTKVVYLQDYTPCRTDADANVQNTAVLTDRAVQVARIYFDRLLNTAPQWAIRRVYSGIISDDDLMPGALFDVIGWSVGPSGPVTFAARSGLHAVTELYDDSKSGIVYDFDLTPTRTIDGVVRRAGGLPPDLERERESWGWISQAPGSISVAGAGLGPYFRRGSALRQGDWASVGTGGRGDRRGRLWRNWQDLDCQEVTLLEQVCLVTDADGHAFGLEHRYRRAVVCGIEYGDTFCVAPAPPCCPGYSSSSSSSASESASGRSLPE